MNDHNNWKKVSQTEPIDLKLFKAHFEELINPRNNLSVKIVRLHSRDACNIICIDPEGYFLFVRQLRFGTMQYTLELPGGLVDPGENTLQTAKRELQEETGYSAPEWLYLKEISSNSVYMDSKVYHFLAKGGILTDRTNLDDAEDISILKMSREEVLEAMQNGSIDHPHTLSALGHYFMFVEHSNH